MMLPRHLPVALVLGLALGCLEGPALAQQAQAPDAMTETARALYDEALVAWKDEKWDLCRAKTSAAWATKQHAQIAGLLGECEFHLKLYRDAAEHLTFYLEKGTDLRPDVRRDLGVLLEGAKKKVASVSVQVDRAGAQVAVDDRPVGVAPLALFLDPGSHAFEARLAGASTARQTLSLEAGSTRTVSLALQAPSAEVSPVPSAASQGSERSWAPAIAGGVVAAGALGAGIAFFAIAGGKASDLETEAGLIRANGGGCNPTRPASLQARCEAFESARSEHNTFVTLGGVGVAVGVTAALGTGVLLLLSNHDSPSSSRQARSASGVSMRVAPAFDTKQGVLSLQGTF